MLLPKVSKNSDDTGNERTKQKTHNCTELNFFFITRAPGCFELNIAGLFIYFLRSLGSKVALLPGPKLGTAPYMTDAAVGAPVGCIGSAASLSDCVAYMYIYIIHIHLSIYIYIVLV